MGFFPFYSYQPFHIQTSFIRKKKYVKGSRWFEIGALSRCGESTWDSERSSEQSHREEVYYASKVSAREKNNKTSSLTDFKHTYFGNNTIKCH